MLASAYAKAKPQPSARRHAATVVPVVITLSTKYTGKKSIGPTVRIRTCCSTVSPGRPRRRRRADDSTGCRRPIAHLTRAPGVSWAMTRASAWLAVTVPVLAGTGTSQHGPSMSAAILGAAA